MGDAPEKLVVIWTDALLDLNGDDCGGWYFAEDQEPPECWTDGVCWDVNADGRKSVEPTHWRPIAAQRGKGE